MKRFRQRKLMDDALDKCQHALDLAANHARVEPPEVIDRDYFWREFSAPELPGPGGDQNSPNDPARVPKKPLPYSRSFECEKSPLLRALFLTPGYRAKLVIIF